MNESNQAGRLFSLMAALALSVFPIAANAGVEERVSKLERDVEQLKKMAFLPADKSAPYDFSLVLNVEKGGGAEVRIWYFDSEQYSSDLHDRRADQYILMHAPSEGELKSKRLDLNSWINPNNKNWYVQISCGRELDYLGRRDYPPCKGSFVLVRTGNDGVVTRPFSPEVKAGWFSSEVKPIVFQEGSPIRGQDLAPIFMINRATGQTVKINF